MELRPKDALLDPDAGLLGDYGVVKEVEELRRDGGKQITMSFAYQDESRGKTAGQQLIGDTQGLQYDTFDVKIGVLRNGWSVDDGGYSDQVLPWNSAKALAENAADWAAKRLSFGLHVQAAGIGLITDEAYRLYNTVNAITSTHILRPNDKAAGALTDSDEFTVELIDDAAQFVTMVEPQIRPAKTPWGDMYCLFISPEQRRALKRTDSAWYASMIASLQGGNQKSGVFTRALGIYNNFVILESQFVPPGLNSGETAFKASTRRAWVGGAGALALAFGKGWNSDPGFDINRWKWIKEEHDFGEQRAFGVRTMVGAARPQYTNPNTSTNHEQGVVVIETYADHGQFTAAQAFRRWTDAAPTATIEA